MSIDDALAHANVFSAGVDIATPITGRFDALMEQETVCWKWFLFVGHVIQQYMMVKRVN